MQRPPLLTDRCLTLLDKLTRSAEHDLESLAGELGTLRREESRLLSRFRAIEQQLLGAQERFGVLHAAGAGIDVEALARQRGWIDKIAEAKTALELEINSLRRHIGPVLDRMQSLQKRMRVLQRAHERRYARLVFGMARRHQQDADEQQLLRTPAWTPA